MNYPWMEIDFGSGSGRFGSAPAGTPLRKEKSIFSAATSPAGPGAVE